ncbi:MAG: cohesin domain-containing protein [Candidatus Acidiferrales bacterium]
MRRTIYLPLVALTAIFLAACPKANQDFEAGRKAEMLQDYDTALVDYERALRANPTNVEYKLRADKMHYQDGQFHLEKGIKDFNQGNLELALTEFQRAQAIDPSNPGADQQIKKTMQLLAAKNASQVPNTADQETAEDQDLLSAPPELKPLSREPINLTMTNDSGMVYKTIAKLAGLSVIFDPEFQQRHISVDLPNVTLEQALDAVAWASKSFWKPLTSSVILVAPDNPQKRKDVEDEEVQTFYLSNTLTPQDLTEVMQGLRQLLDLRRVQQVDAQNAIVIRATPDELALASKIINDLDKAKPEVLIHVQVLAANRDRLRDLGILPGQSVSVAFTPGGVSSSTTTPTTQIALNELQHLSTADWAITLPGATANAILSDNKTQVIQDPEVRIVDGEKATLKVGEKYPIATGSFQAGVGVSANSVSPLVNTQFTYTDVGVQLDVTPRIHPDGDVSMKLTISITSIAQNVNIGGITQPVISQRDIENDIRLKDGESSVLGGLIERDETTNLNGIPGVAQVPLLRYLFSDNSHEVVDQELLIVLTPHVIRFPSIDPENLRTLAAGTDSNARVYREEDEVEKTPQPEAGPATPAPSTQASPQPAAAPAAQLHFDPATVSMKMGDRTTLGLAVSNVNDLYSIPLLIHYDPAVIQVEEVRDGGFLSGGTQEIAIVQNINEQRGELVVSATRQPNTPGVNGSGTLLGIVVRAVGPGTSTLQVLQVNARNSQQQSVPLVSGVASIQVQ